MKKWIAKLRNKINYNREWDFEARCPQCTDTIPIRLTVMDSNTVVLQALPCEKHGETFILWPCRYDIIREDA